MTQEEIIRNSFSTKLPLFREFCRRGNVNQDQDRFSEIPLVEAKKFFRRTATNFLLVRLSFQLAVCYWLEHLRDSSISSCQCERLQWSVFLRKPIRGCDAEKETSGRLAEMKAEFLTVLLLICFGITAGSVQFETFWKCGRDTFFGRFVAHNSFKKMFRFFETKFEKTYLLCLLYAQDAQICWLHIRIFAVEFAHNSIVCLFACASILLKLKSAVKSALRYLYTSVLQFIQWLGKTKNSPTLVLVTHHVEEIMPVFSDLLVLKNGKVLAAGKKSSVLKTELLSKAFAARLRLDKMKNRYSLNVLPTIRGMM
jgi:hypothetical protein